MWNSSIFAAFLCFSSQANRHPGSGNSHVVQLARKAVNMVNGLYLYSSLTSPEDPKTLHTTFGHSCIHSHTGDGKLQCSQSYPGAHWQKQSCWSLAPPEPLTTTSRRGMWSSLLKDTMACIKWKLELDPQFLCHMPTTWPLMWLKLWADTVLHVQKVHKHFSNPALCIEKLCKRNHWLLTDFFFDL